MKRGHNNRHWESLGLTQRPICHKVGKCKRNGLVLYKYHEPQLNQDQVSSLNRPKSREEIEAVIENLPINKSPVPDGFNAEFNQKFQEELIPILLKVFHIIET